MAYDGTDFEGFQTQPHGRPTIQDALEKRLSNLFYPPLRGAQAPSSICNTIQPAHQDGGTGTGLAAGSASSAEPAEAEENGLLNLKPRAAVTIIGAGRTDAGVHARAQVSTKCAARACAER